MNTTISILLLIGTVLSILYVVNERSVQKHRTISNVKPFSTAEKMYILFIICISPVMSGAIFYYGLIKVSPKKAKTANLFSFAIIILYGLALYLIKLGKGGI